MLTTALKLKKCPLQGEKQVLQDLFLTGEIHGGQYIEFILKVF